MPRWDTIFHDRVELLKRGLVKAGYLPVPQGDGDDQGKKDKSFRDLAASVLTDLLHLGVLDYQVTVRNGGRDSVELGSNDLNDGERRQAVSDLLQQIAAKASDNFVKERRAREFP